MAGRLTCPLYITPCVPSTVTIWLFRKIWVACPVPTTAGMPSSRAIRAACEVAPPVSVIIARTFFKAGMKVGLVISVTKISPCLISARSSGLCIKRTGPVSIPSDAPTPWAISCPREPGALVVLLCWLGTVAEFSVMGADSKKYKISFSKPHSTFWGREKCRSIFLLQRKSVLISSGDNLALDLAFPLMAVCFKSAPRPSFQGWKLMTCLIVSPDFLSSTYWSGLTVPSAMGSPSPSPASTIISSLPPVSGLMVKRIPDFCTLIIFWTMIAAPTSKWLNRCIAR